MEPDNGVKAAHALHHLIAVFIKDDLIVFYLEGLADIGYGNGENGISHRYLHPVHNGKGKRNLHGHCGAGSVLAGNGDSAAHGFHIFLNHVHAHAAARVFRHSLVGGKAGNHNKA